MPRGIRVKTCEGAAALQAERGPERGRWRRGTHLPVLCAHWPSLSPRPVLHCGQHPKNPAVQWSCSLLHSGLSLQHVGQWSCSLSRRGFPCSTWVSGPVLCRAGAFPAARGSGSTPSSSGGLSLQHVGQWSCSLSCGDFPCSTWVRVHPIPGAPAPLFADVLFQTPGPTQPWFPRAYLAAPSAFPAHF